MDPYLNRVLVTCDSDDRLIAGRMDAALSGQVIVIGCDIARDRIDHPIDGWADMYPDLPRYRPHPLIVPGPIVEHVATAEPLGRRAARRARGRARAARRVVPACTVAGDGSPLGPSAPLSRRG